MTFDQIKSFYLIATLGTFAKAAARLNSSQPTLSARIAGLESSLGVQLFDRSGHRVALTAHGRQFLRHAEKLLEIQRDAINQIGGKKLSGIVRIGSSGTIAEILLSGFLTDLRSRQPDIGVELFVGTSHRLLASLEQRELDVAFIVGPNDRPRIIERPLCEIEMGLVAHRDLRLHGRRLDLAALQRVDFFTFERGTQPYRELTERLAGLGIPSQVSSINSLETVMILLMGKLGIGAVPKTALRDERWSQALCPVDTGISLSNLRFFASHVHAPDNTIGALLSDMAQAYLRQRAVEKFIKIF